MDCAPVRNTRKHDVALNLYCIAALSAADVYLLAALSAVVTYSSN